MLVTLRNDGRLNFVITEKAAFRPAGGVDGAMMPAAWHHESLGDETENYIAEIVLSMVS